MRVSEGNYGGGNPSAGDRIKRKAQAHGLLGKLGRTRYLARCVWRGRRRQRRGRRRSLSPDGEYRRGWQGVGHVASDCGCDEFVVPLRHPREASRCASDLDTLGRLGITSHWYMSGG